MLGTVSQVSDVVQGPHYTFYFCHVKSMSTYIDHFEGPVVGVHLYPEQVLDLTGEDVDGRPRGEAADEWVRHERCQSPEPETAEEELEKIRRDPRLLLNLLIVEDIHIKCLKTILSYTINFEQIPAIDFLFLSIKNAPLPKKKEKKIKQNLKTPSLKNSKKKHTQTNTEIYQCIRMSMYLDNSRHEGHRHR